jgi:hypothetical protein
MAIPDRVLRLFLSVTLVLSAAISLGQTAGDPNQGGLGPGQQTESKPRTFSGQVVNSITGQPIARALVQLGGRHATLTDHEGRFEFDNAVEDSGTAFVTKPGYFPQDNEGISQGQSITLQLIPEAILFGTITDQTGQPIQDLTVQLKMLQVSQGLRHWQSMMATTTNAEGEYRFAELQAGKYSLATGFKIEGLPEAASSVAFLPVAYPPLGGDGVNGALTLAPGDRIEANIIPTVGKLYPVAGQVNGRFAMGVGFEFETKDGESVAAPVHFYPTGAFRMMLPSGSYHFKARATVEREQFLGTGEITVAQAPLEGVSINLGPQTTIPVEVEYQAVSTDTQRAPSAAPPNPNLLLQEDDPAGPMRMFPAQPPQASARNPAPDPGGRLVFQNVEPGHYALQAQLQPPWYLASASCGNVDLTRDPLVISPGSSACVLRVVLRDDCASLKYSVTASDANSPTSHGFVVAIPLGNRAEAVTTNFFSSQRLTAATPAEGSFECLAPGRYLLIALQHQQELPYRDAEALQRYSSLGQEVTMTRNGKSEVQLQIVAGEP